MVPNLPNIRRQRDRLMSGQADIFPFAALERVAGLNDIEGGIMRTENAGQAVSQGRRRTHDQASNYSAGTR